MVSFSEFNRLRVLLANWTQKSPIAANSLCMQFAFVLSNFANWVIRCRASVENEFVHCSLFTAN